MSKHYSEADLLETYYTQPGESLPVMMHLADCAECAARYERLERKIRGTASCHREQPETFWTRQRLMIQRRVEEQKKRSLTVSQMMRVAAAAALAFLLGGVAMYRTIEPSPPHVVKVETVATTSTTPAATASTDTALPASPWQSEELDEFHSMVDWEQWGDPKS
jgi:anti-sigma factor RsiW